MKHPFTKLDAAISDLQAGRKRGYLDKGKGPKQQRRRDTLARLLWQRRKRDRAWKAQ